MTSKPRKDQKRSREAHIYMTEREYESLRQRAHDEDRSVNGQILHFIKLGLSN